MPPDLILLLVAFLIGVFVGGLVISALVDRQLESYQTFCCLQIATNTDYKRDNDRLRELLAKKP